MGLFGGTLFGGGSDKGQKALLDEEKRLAEEEQRKADELKAKEAEERRTLTARGKGMQGGGRQGLMSGRSQIGVL